MGTLRRHFKNDFQFDGGAEWQAGDAIDQAAGAFVFSKDALQQLGSGIGDLRLIADVSGSSNRNAKTYDSSDFVERSHMLAGDSEKIEGSELSGLARCLDVEFGTDTANKFRAVTLGGKHAAEKKQIAGLHGFHVGAKGLGWRGETDAKFF